MIEEDSHPDNSSHIASKPSLLDRLRNLGKRAVDKLPIKITPKSKEHLYILRKTAIKGAMQIHKNPTAETSFSVILDLCETFIPEPAPIITPTPTPQTTSSQPAPEEPSVEAFIQEQIADVKERIDTAAYKSEIPALQTTIQKLNRDLEKVIAANNPLGDQNSHHLLGLDETQTKPPITPSAPAPSIEVSGPQEQLNQLHSLWKLFLENTYPDHNYPDSIKKSLQALTRVSSADLNVQIPTHKLVLFAPEKPHHKDAITFFTTHSNKLSDSQIKLITSSVKNYGRGIVKKLLVSFNTLSPTERDTFIEANEVLEPRDPLNSELLTKLGELFPKLNQIQSILDITTLEPSGTAPSETTDLPETPLAHPPQSPPSIITYPTPVALTKPTDSIVSTPETTDPNSFTKDELELLEDILKPLTKDLYIKAAKLHPTQEQSIQEKIESHIRNLEKQVSLTSLSSHPTDEVNESSQKWENNKISLSEHVSNLYKIKETPSLPTFPSVPPETISAEDISTANVHLPNIDILSQPETYPLPQSLKQLKNAQKAYIKSSNLNRGLWYRVKRLGENIGNWYTGPTSELSFSRINEIKATAAEKAYKYRREAFMRDFIDEHVRLMDKTLSDAEKAAFYTVLRKSCSQRLLKLMTETETLRADKASLSEKVSNFLGRHRIITPALTLGTATGLTLGMLGITSGVAPSAALIGITLAGSYVGATSILKSTLERFAKDKSGKRINDIKGKDGVVHLYQNDEPLTPEDEINILSGLLARDALQPKSFRKTPKDLPSFHAPHTTFQEHITLEPHQEAFHTQTPALEESAKVSETRIGKITRKFRRTFSRFFRNKNLLLKSLAYKEYDTIARKKADILTGLLDTHNELTDKTGNKITERREQRLKASLPFIYKYFS